MKVPLPPKIRHEERGHVDVERDVMTYETDSIGAAMIDLTRRVRDEHEKLLARIAILYPSLPDGYVWAEEMMSETSFFDEKATLHIRYRPRHVSELGSGARYFRP